MFKEIQVKAFDCKCDNCKHEWRSIREDLPTHCPNKGCSNPTRWNIGGTKQKYVRKSSAKVEEKDQTSKYTAPQTNELVYEFEDQN